MKKNPFSVKRVKTPGEYRLLDIVHGLENSNALQKLFGGKDETLRVLSHVKLKTDNDGYGVWFERSTAKICMNIRYLRKAKNEYLYLDTIHVLVHLKQFLEGKDNSETIEYVDRPTEIEAYRYTVEEAKAIGLSTKEILAYLRFETSDEEFKKLVEKIGIRARR